MIPFLPYIAGAQALTLAAVVGVYFHGTAKVSACQADSAIEALGYERLFADRDATIATLKADLETQRRSMETAQQVANLAASRAAERALRQLRQPRPVIEGSGPEVMNQWLD